MNLPDFLTEVEYGEIRLTGHRIGLFHVVERYKKGFTPEMIHEEFPTLPLELIRNVIAFYHDNRAEVDVYVAREREEIDRQAAAAPRVDWEKMRRRMEERKRAENR